MVFIRFKMDAFFSGKFAVDVGAKMFLISNNDDVVPLVDEVGVFCVDVCASSITGWGAIDGT